MSDKCVCNIMGYKVKDSTAREMIETLSQMLENKDSIIEKNKNGELKFWIGTEEEFSALTEKPNNCLYFTKNGENIDLTPILISIEVDTELDENSNNPLANKTIWWYITVLEEAIDELRLKIVEANTDILYKEDTSNRVQVIDENSHGLQYPSAMAVYNYVEGIKAELLDYIGDVENGSY